MFWNQYIKVKGIQDKTILRLQVAAVTTKFQLLFLEITSLGFISKQSYEPFPKSWNQLV